MLAHPEQNPVDLAEYFHDRSILIVEDRPNMLRTIRNMLRNMGVPPRNIVTASDGREALKKSKGLDRPDFMLLDIYLPRLSGIELLRELEQLGQLKDTLVLIITADSHEEMVGQAFEAGASGYLIKPFTEDTLKQKILNIIARPAFLEQFEAVERLIDEERFDEALQWTDEIVKTMPYSPGALLLRGTALEGLHRDIEALASYETALDYSPIYLRVIKKLIDYHRSRGHTAEALTYLKQADALNPYHPGRKLDLGRISLESDRPGRAERYFEAAISIDPDLAFEAAAICLEKRPDLAEKYYRMALERTLDLRTLNQLGMALRAQGKWLEAIQEYNRALKISPGNAGIFFNIGRAYLQGHQERDAVSYFRRAVDVAPEMHEARAALERLTLKERGG
ncbi:MAG: response regulator [Proteobacteria bacterium]|nr:response regulator [Pseudomonadota bacterium]